MTNPAPNPRLAELEAEYDREEQRGFVRLGAILRVIHDERLYKADYGSWERYAKQRRGLSRADANRLIKAVETAENCPQIGDSFTRESHFRELERIDHDPDALQRVVQRVNEQEHVTAATIREEVNRELGTDVDPNNFRPKPPPKRNRLDVGPVCADCDTPLACPNCA